MCATIGIAIRQGQESRSVKMNANCLTGTSIVKEIRNSMKMWITREIMHKMLDEMLTKIENGEEVNTARLERAFLTDEGEIKIKEYCLKILLGEREYGY